MLTIDNDPLDGWMIRWRERERHIQSTGFVKPTAELGAWIGKFCPWVEIGAGSGALAQAINDNGGRCVATDTFDWHDLKSGDLTVDLQWNKTGVIKARGERVGRLLSHYPSVGLLTSWPEYMAPWAYEAARHLKPGQLICYIGEWGGCTADEDFHKLLETEFEEVDECSVNPWSGLHDHCWVMRRIPRS